MKHYGREDIGVVVPEGGGYIGTLNVYHELHCLKRIHQFMYPEYYFADLSEQQHEMNRLHNGELLHLIRLVLLLCSVFFIFPLLTFIFSS